RKRLGLQDERGADGAVDAGVRPVGVAGDEPVMVELTVGQSAEGGADLGVGAVVRARGVGRALGGPDFARVGSGRRVFDEAFIDGGAARRFDFAVQGRGGVPDLFEVGRVGVRVRKDVPWREYDDFLFRFP